MGITITALVASAACDAIVDLVDVGGAGTLEIKSAQNITPGTATLATLTFAATAFNPASAGVAAAAAIGPETSATAGTASNYTVFSGAATPIWEGLVATAASDLNLSSVSIGAGDTVSVSSFTLTVPLS